MTAENIDAIRSISKIPLLREVSNVCAYAASDLSGKPQIVCMLKLQRGEPGNSCIAQTPLSNCPGSLHIKAEVVNIVKKRKKKDL